MERTTADVVCIIVAGFAQIGFILDLIGLAWAMIRKKPYKSLIGSFIEYFNDYNSLFWLPIIIALLFAYGLTLD